MFRSFVFLQHSSSLSFAETSYVIPDIYNLRITHLVLNYGVIRNRAIYYTEGYKALCCRPSGKVF
jgi:hypothetical protein